MGYIYGNKSKPSSSGGIVYGKNGRRSESGNTTSVPAKAVANYQERLRLAGIPDEVKAREEDPRNIIEKALNLPKKSSVLGNIFDILSRPAYASANIAKEVTDERPSNVLDVLKAGWKGFTGQERTTYSDVLEQAGMKKGALRSGLGFALDVALDPTTYLTLGTGTAGKTALKFAGKTVPKTEKAIAEAKKAIAPIRETLAATEPVQAVGKALKGFRFRPAGVSEAEFKPWVERVEQFQKEYRVKPARAMEEAIKEGKKFTPEEQVMAGKIRETASLDKLKVLQEKGSIYPEHVVSYAAKWANINKNLVKEAQNTGLKINELEDYLAHIPGKDWAELSKKAKMQTLGGQTRPLKAYDPNARARTIQGTVDEINKRMGGEFFEPRMPVADAVRNARLERAIAIQKFLNDVAKNWATPIKKRQTPPPGWKIWEPQGPFRFYPTKTGEVGVTTKNVPRYAVPEHVADYLEEAMRAFDDDKATKKLRDMYLKVQRLWTVSVTGLSPGYHSRNIQGNLFNSFLAGMRSPRPYYDALGMMAGKTGKTAKGIPYEQIMKEFKDEGLDISNFLSREPGEDIISSVRRAVEGKKPRPLERVREAGNKIETTSKLALFTDMRNKGKSAKEAADIVRKYLFDYQDLTPTERKIKILVPFYTWSRKNIPLQFESMITQPGKYAGAAKAFRAIEDLSNASISESDLPDWFKEEYAVRLPYTNKKGEQLYWLPNLPLMDVNTLGYRDLYSRLSPLIKLGPDYLARQNLSLGIPFEQYKGQTVEYPFGVRVPATTDYLVKQFGVVRNVGNVMSTMADTEKAKGWLETILGLLGISNYPLNPEKAATSRQYRLQEEYADYMRRLGEIGERPPTLTELRRTRARNKKGKGYVY